MKIKCEVVGKDGKIKFETLDYPKSIWKQIFIDLTNKEKLLAEYSVEGKLQKVIVND